MNALIHVFITFALISGIVAGGVYQFMMPHNDLSRKQSIQMLGYSNEITYDEFVNKTRQKFTTSIGNRKYLDYLNRALYTDAQILQHSDNLNSNLYGNPHSESKSSELANDLIEDLRISILEMFNTDLGEYTCIFTQSRIAALKLIPEAFPFNDKSSFMYSSTSDSDIIGLSSFAHNKKAKVTSFKPYEPLQVTFSKLSKNSNNMIIAPLVDKFDGRALEDEEIDELLSAKSQGNYTVVIADASQYLQTNTIDLSIKRFDAVAFSFDALVGFPTLGVVIIKNELIRFMEKPYFGGGTLVYALTTQPFEKLRLKPAQRLEDGSLPFLTIVAAQDATDIVKTLGNSRLEYVSRMGDLLNESLSSLECVDIIGSPSSNIAAFKINSSRQFSCFDAFENGFSVDCGCLSAPGTCPDNAIKASVGWLTLERDITEFADWINQYYCV